MFVMPLCAMSLCLCVLVVKKLTGVTGADR